MKTKTIRRWRKIIDFPGGHRVFVTSDGAEPGEPMKYAIADRSGVTPDATDDGALLLDFARTPWADGRHITIGDKYATIPVVSDKGVESWVSMPAPHVAKIADHFHAPIRCGELFLKTCD